MFATVVLFVTVTCGLQKIISQYPTHDAYLMTTYFWFRMFTDPLELSFVHASTWFLFPSRNTRPDSPPCRRVRPTVVLGKVGTEDAEKLPGRTWYERISATRETLEEILEGTAATEVSR